MWCPRTRHVLDYQVNFQDRASGTPPVARLTMASNLPHDATKAIEQSNRTLSQPAHCLTSQEAAAQLGTNEENGLTAQVAEERLKTYGNNTIGDDEGVQPIKILIHELANAMTLVLLHILSHVLFTYD